MSRIEREKKTVEAMIKLYCNRNHGTILCPNCTDLLSYSLKRLDTCRFGENKPTCAACAVHCYAPSQREKIRTVMRYAGPRMLVYHPVLAIRHMRDGRKKRSTSEEQ